MQAAARGEEPCRCLPSPFILQKFKGNNYRTIMMVVFFAGTAAVRFIGTHAEYDKIKDIKTI